MSGNIHFIRNRGGYESKYSSDVNIIYIYFATRSSSSSKKLYIIVKLLHFQVVEFERMGRNERGVFSTNPFRKGAFVVAYHGELITADSAKWREAKYSKKRSIGCYMYYFTWRNKNYWYVFAPNY